MKQPVLNVNGKKFKVHDIGWFESGEICSVSILVGGESVTIFNKTYDSPWDVPFDGSTPKSNEKLYALNLNKEGLITLERN